MLEAFTSFLAVGALGFFLYLVVISIACVVAAETDRYGLAIFFVLGGCVYYFTDITRVLATTDWKVLVGISMTYVVAGVLWSLYRWMKYCRGILANNDRLEISSTLKYQLNVRHNSSRITGWIAFWPWSLVWTLTGDFFRTIYESMIAVYTKISDNIMNEAIKRKDIVNKID